MHDFAAHKTLHVVDGQETDGGAVVGTDFVAYWVGTALGEQVNVSTIAPNATPLAIAKNTSVPARLATNDHRLVYATVRGDQSIVHVVDFA